MTARLVLQQALQVVITLFCHNISLKRTLTLGGQAAPQEIWCLQSIINTGSRTSIPDLFHLTKSYDRFDLARLNRQT